jgi:glucosamine-phosphate N-acetyltransferase
VGSIHNLGLVGHIEDIVVNKDQQGKKLGLRIIEALDYIAEKVGCYKVNLFPPAFFAPYNPLAAHARALLFTPQLAQDTNHSLQTILDCSETNEGFYVKCGYKRVGLEMAHYYEKK